jgi:gamma-glutamyltranspeptidase/glutathione hydrolase
MRLGLLKHPSQGLRRLRAGCVAVLLSFVAPSLAQERPPGMAVATAHAAATRAGIEVMQSGGNAFDAAVAVSAALAVVEPYSSGLGGGGFWLLHRAADGLQTMVDGRETAPGAAHPDMYLDVHDDVVPGLSVDGPLSAGIPGVPAALEHIATRYGRLPLSRTLAPAIGLARDGFAVTPLYRRLAGFRLESLRASPASASLFLDDNEVPAEGHVVRQPDLAATLEAMASHGKAGFYEGPIAAALVRGVRAAGGIWSAEDLRSYRVLERRPLLGKYGGLTVVSAAPPSSGGVALLTMLNILAGDDLTALDPTARVHLLVEAMRRAYRDRAEYLGDPDYADVPVARLVDPAYAASLREGIRPDRATPSTALVPVQPSAQGPHTTHFSILDAEGNRVAATLSINYPFGSGFTPPGTGVLLNDEMDDFSAKPGVPNVYGLVGAEANAIAPGKRPLSSMSPSFVEGPGRVGILGTPGGSRIITMVLLGILDFAEDHGPASWVSLPRFHHQYLPDEIQFEPGALSEVQVRGLERLGHRLEPLSSPYGNMQAILWDAGAGRLEAASDPRGEGLALVETPAVQRPLGRVRESAGQ